MLISLYSLFLAVALALTSPWWLYRMVTSNRYRDGLWERLGRVPHALRAAAKGKQVIWLHAVSVGELLAAQRLMAELQEALGPGYLMAVSTTTATAQKLARERLKLTADGSQSQSSSDVALFYYPLDFAFAVRAYLRALKPKLVILMESELWPRLLHECDGALIPVAVANARVSDRSFRRTYPFRSVWLRMARHVTVFLAQSQETATRLEALGIPPTRIQTPGNLKYDPLPLAPNRLVESLRPQLAQRKVIVAGSTLPASPHWEEEALLLGMQSVWAWKPDTLLILAPRHPQRFADVRELLADHGCTVISATQFHRSSPLHVTPKQVLLLDTLGDLASVYQLADVAFIGGSFEDGGHNPLEAARFGIPILIGPSYENFREIVDLLRSHDAIYTLSNREELGELLIDLLQQGASMGKRAQTIFQSQAGATTRVIAALLPLLKPEPQR